MGPMGPSMGPSMGVRMEVLGVLGILGIPIRANVVTLFILALRAIIAVHIHYSYCSMYPSILAWILVS